MKTPAFFQRSELSSTLWLFRREFGVCILFTAVVNILMLTPTLYMLQVFDRVMLSGSELTLAALTLIMLFFFAVMAFAEWSRSRLLVRTGVKLDEKLNSRIFNASFESHLSQLGKNPAQAFSDLTNLRQYLTGQGLFALIDIPWTPIYIIVLFMLHPVLGFLAIFFALMLGGLAYLSHKKTFEPIDKAAEAGAQTASYVYSKLRNSEVIESMGMMEDLRRRWQQRHQNHLRLHSKAQDLGHRMQVLTKFVSYTQQSLTLGTGALLAINGEITAGAMIASNALLSRATQPVSTMVSTWKSTLTALKSFARLEALLQEHPERQSGLIHAAPEGHVRIENLVARAPNREAPILKGLTADFPPGQIIGVIGPSGSGKSTLARALVGIWPQVEGRVLIDGEPIESWDREELGPSLGYLPQDIELFEGSIAENIARFGEIDSEKVIRAAQRTGVHEMVLRLPQGYDTPMGVAGSLLSGGQRQRIGLARALYGDPTLIVLDEPNSNLDDVGEAALVAAVEAMKRDGKTIFLITHRLNIIGITDTLLVLNDGQIQLFGTRQDVISALQSRAASAAPLAADGNTPSAAPAV